MPNLPQFPSPPQFTPGPDVGNALLGAENIKAARYRNVLAENETSPGNLSIDNQEHMMKYQRDLLSHFKDSLQTINVEQFPAWKSQMIKFGFDPASLPPDDYFYKESENGVKVYDENTFHKFQNRADSTSSAYLRYLDAQATLRARTIVAGTENPNEGVRLKFDPEKGDYVTQEGKPFNLRNPAKPKGAGAGGAKKLTAAEQKMARDTLAGYILPEVQGIVSKENADALTADLNNKRLTFSEMRAKLPDDIKAKWSKKKLDWIAAKTEDNLNKGILQENAVQDAITRWDTEGPQFHTKEINDIQAGGKVDPNAPPLSLIPPGPAVPQPAPASANPPGLPDPEGFSRLHPGKMANGYRPARDAQGNWIWQKVK